MSVTIKYKGNTIASANTDTTKTLQTSGKYCEADILVENVQDGGITPSGKKLITDTSETDVAAFATAQVSSNTLLPENIKKDVNILGVVGSFEGGGGGGLNTIDTTVTLASASNKVTITGYDLTDYHFLFLELRCRSTVADVNSGFRLYAGTYSCYNPDNLTYPDIATAITTQGGNDYTHTASLATLVTLRRHILYNQAGTGVYEDAKGGVVTIGDNSFSFQMGYNLCAGLTYDIKGVWI